MTKKEKPERTPGQKKFANTVMIVGTGIFIYWIATADNYSLPTKATYTPPPSPPISAPRPKATFTEKDFRWDKNTTPYKDIIIKGVNKVHRENSRCDIIDPMTADVSLSKGTKKDPVFYVTCGAGSSVFNAFFSMSDVMKDAPMPAAEHIEQSLAVDICEVYAKVEVESKGYNPYTMKFEKPGAVTEHPNGRTTVITKFTVKSSIGLDHPYNIRCLLDKDKVIDAVVTQ